MLIFLLFKYFFLYFNFKIAKKINICPHQQFFLPHYQKFLLFMSLPAL